MRRSKHSLSNYKVFSCDGGYLVPVGLQEVLPGDVFNHKIRGLVRAAPMIAPVMHIVDVRLHAFFVPNRLLWDDWENFITGGPDGTDASVPPTVTLTYTAGNPPTGTNLVGGLPDYLGVPPGINNLEVSALPFRAYNKIFNEYYRDQDLVSPRAISTASGADSTTDVSLARIAWEKDYFTSARPWESKGPTLTLPLGEMAPVVSAGVGVDGQPQFKKTNTGDNLGGLNAIGGGTAQASFQNVGTGPQGPAEWQDPKLMADLSQATNVGS